MGTNLVPRLKCTLSVLLVAVENAVVVGSRVKVDFFDLGVRLVFGSYEGFAGVVSERMRRQAGL